jgi:hypothetical protein
MMVSVALAVGMLPRMKSSKTLIPAALGALALASAAAAAHPTEPVAHAAGLGNKIVLYKSVGGISLGVTPATVVHKLGKPSHTIHVAGKVAEYEYSTKHDDPIVNVDFDTNNSRDLEPCTTRAAC